MNPSAPENPRGPDAQACADAPRVWLDYTQAELDAAYDQAAYAPNMQAVLKRYAAHSEAARAALGEPARHRYGQTEVEALDWFPAERPDAPVHIFIHGGAWRSGEARSHHFPARHLVPAGAHYVVPDFTNALATDGDLRPMLDQVRRAIAWVGRHAASLGADPTRIHASSHSSGSHLLACAALTDWQADFDLPADLLKSVLYCGGIYDMAPVMLSSRRHYLDAPPPVAAQLSPLRHVRALALPICVAYGERETPEFRRQSIEFAAALREAGNEVQTIEEPGANHFEILETLASADGSLARVVRGQMGLE